jgi:hypothetical protein
MNDSLETLREKRDRYYSPLFGMLQGVAVNKNDLISRIISLNMENRLLAGKQSNAVLDEYLATIDETSQESKLKCITARFLKSFSEQSLSEYKEILDEIFRQTGKDDNRSFQPNFIGLNQLIKALCDEIVVSINKGY